MRKIQKLTLSLLSLAAISSWNTAFAGDHMDIRVDDGESAEYSAVFVGTADKIYAGTVKFTGDESGMTNLKIKGGKAQFNGPSAEMPLAIEFAVAPGEGDVVAGDHVVVEVLTNGATSLSLNNVTLPTLDMQTDGDVYANSNTVVTINGLGAGTGTLNLYSGSVTGADYIGVTVPADLSASSNPINVYGETHFGATGSKLTTGQTTVKGGGLLEVVAATAGAAPGPVVVEADAILEVAGNITIPAQGDAGDVFTDTLKFENNSTLWLRNNVVWDRDITVGTAS